MVTKAQIQKLEKLYRQRNSVKEKSIITVPSEWGEFARMVQIRSGGDVKKFDPYPYQEKLVKLMLERSVVVVKSRQLGVSETITCFLLWRACLNPGYLGLVFSKTQTDSSLLARRMKRMIASLGLKTTTENLSDIEILGHGRILFRNSKPDSARGIESVVDCFLDELAFLESGKEVYDALAPAMQMVGNKARVFAVSTPGGKSGFFWDLLSNNNGDRDIEDICTQASNGDGDPFQYWVDSGNWAKVLIHWKAHPIYGSRLNFLQEIHEKQKLSWEVIDREYNLSFASNEENFFDYQVVRECIGEFFTEKKFSSVYSLGIDPNFGGSDYCVSSLLEYTSQGVNVSFPYRKKQQTTEYNLLKISEIIREYHIKTIVVETNSGGSVYLEQLSREFPYLTVSGVKTTAESKATMLGRLTLALEKKSLRYASNSPIVEELLNFRRKGKKLEAAQGKYDDTIMATCFALVGLENLGLL